MQAVHDELCQRNIPVELFTEKRIQRRQLPISNDTLVVGFVPTVLAAVKLLGLQAPPTNDYPQALQSFLRRRIWQSTVAQLISHIYEGGAPIFAKPQGRKKRFTGHVFAQPDDLQYLENASNTTPILCAEVVEWLSEYRVFVVRSNIVGIKHYSGDPAIKIDERIIADAIQRLGNSGEITAGYGMDFGVMRTGQTALVEWNDGFSLGSYGLDRVVYTDLLIARWCEITGNAPTTS